MSTGGGGGGGGSFNPPPGGKGDIPNPWTFSSGGTITQTDVTQAPAPQHGDITGDGYKLDPDPDQLSGSLTWAASENTLPPQTSGTTINYTPATNTAPFTGLWESTMTGVCSAAAQTGALGTFSPGSVNGYAIVAIGRVVVVGTPYFMIEMAPGTPQNFFSTLVVNQSSTQLGTFTEATATFVPQGNTILGLVPTEPGPSWYWPCPFNMTGGVAGTFVFASPVVTPSPLRGDISSDAQYSPDGRATPVTFAAGGTPLAVGPVAPPTGKGDISLTYEGADGQKQTVYGEITWAQGGGALVPAATAPIKGKGDITGDYGQTELWQEIATWATAGRAALVLAPLPAVTGKGDFPDPNTWEDHVFYLTSHLYSIEVFEHVQMAGFPMNSPQPANQDNMTNAGQFLGGQWWLGLVTYTNWPTETITGAGLFTGGVITTSGGAYTYSNWTPEHIQGAGSFTGGNWYLGLVTYTNGKVEHIQQSASFTGGTLT